MPHEYNGNRKPGADGIAWQLDAMYAGPGDPEIDRDLNKAEKKAIAFAKSYEGRLNSVHDARELVDAIKEYESINEMVMKPYQFALLFHSQDTRDKNRTMALNRIRKKRDDILSGLIFFEVEIRSLPGERLTTVACRYELTEYRHYLQRQCLLKNYTLNISEEKELKRKNASIESGPVSLYDQVMASISYFVESGDVLREFTGNQALQYLHSPDKALREDSFSAFLQALSNHGPTITGIMNEILLARQDESDKRGFSSLMQETSLENGLEEPVIETALCTVESFYPLARRYFRLKADIMKKKKLLFTDITAPFNSESFTISFSDARHYLSGSLGRLHQRFKETLIEVFEGHIIDAQIRPGKQSGAFCKCLSPSRRPYISLNYTGSTRSLMELSHELGHAVNYMLASKQSHLNFSPAPFVSEMAATFSELVLFNSLAHNKVFESHAPSLLSCFIDGIILTVFRQTVLTRFEQKMHKLRRGHLIAEDEICTLWLKENTGLYEDCVETAPGYAWGWAYIQHFIHKQFYCSAYVLGNLMSILLFQRYSQEGKSVMDSLITLMEMGSAVDPSEALRNMGVDPVKAETWMPAFNYIEQLVDSFEAYTMEYLSE